MVQSSKVEKAEAKYDVSMNYSNLELHSAAASGNVGLVHYALTHGQPVNSVLHGVLPLHAACSGGSEPVVRMLIDRGADVNAPRLPSRYNEKGKSTPSIGHSGSTPLHFAAANGHARIVRILLASGATYDKQDKHGATPLTLAEANGHEEVVETLLTWTALLEEEKVKIRLEMMEDREGKDGCGDDVFEDEDASPVLEKEGKWKARSSSASQGEGEKNEKAELRQSIENIFLGRRSNPPRPLSIDESQSGGSSAGFNSTPGSAVPNRVQEQKLGGRRPSLPSIFERASHPGQSLRAAWRRGSQTNQTRPVDITSLRRSATQKSFDDSASSIGSSTTRQLTKQSLLNLFRRGTGQDASPPSRSPSPPRPALLPLSSGDLDDSVEKLRRASMEGPRPGAGYGRPRSISQVTFQHSVAGRSSTTSASSGGSSNSRARAIEEGVEQTCDADSRALTGGEEGTEAETAAGPGPSTAATLTDHPSSRFAGPETTGDPSRVPHRPRSRLSSEVVTPSPLGLDLDTGGGPRSILKHRNEGGGGGAHSPLSPMSPLFETHSAPTSPLHKKRRAATLPSTYSPRQQRYTNGDVESVGLVHMSPENQPHTEDGQLGLSRNGRRRGTSIGSLRSSPAGSFRESSNRTPSVAEEPADIIGDVTVQVAISEEGLAQKSGGSSQGRFRNKSISSISSFTSINGQTYSTEATSYTPSMLSSNIHGQVVPYTQIQEGSSELPTSKTQYLGRRSSLRATEVGALLYDVPVPVSYFVAPPNASRRIATREEADEFMRQTERDILEAISIPSTAESPGFSLAAQLAAYGDTHAFVEQLGSSEVGSFNEVDAPKILEGQVSRSYIQRPPSIRQESAESNDTIVESASVRTSTNSRSISDSGIALPGASVDFADRGGGSRASGKVRSQPPAPIFVPKAPGSSLPSINRIYESRAAAYRIQGKALAQTAPIFASSGRVRSASRPNPIQDHWAIAGPKHVRSASASAGSGSEMSHPAISSPLPQLMEPSNDDSSKRKKLHPSGASTSDWSGKPTENASSNARIGSLASVESPANTTSTLPPPLGYTSQASESPAHSGKSSPPPKKTQENGVAAEVNTNGSRSESARRASMEMVSNRLGKMTTGTSSRKASGSSMANQSRRSSEGKNNASALVPNKAKWGDSIKSAMGALGRHK